MKVLQLLPTTGEIELSECLAASDHGCSPFAPELVDFCAALCFALMNDPEARGFPELQALAFWMRKAAVTRMQRDFEALQSSSCFLVPRGLVFHIPPTNVDTIFLYSWALAFLTGNRNIIRLSSRESPQAAIMVRLFRTLAAKSGMANTNTIVLRYGHDAQITEMISSTVDVRIIWGGDDTIRQIRAAPLPPHAKEICFPDRTSLAALKTDAYLSLTEPEKQALAERFYNDTYWFDQMACSSPRLVAWCGDVTASSRASDSFYACLRNQIARKGYSLATGPFLKKLAFAHGAILDSPVSRYAQYGNELTVVTLKTATGWGRQRCGGGFLYEVFLPDLEALQQLVGRPVQTFAAFGFQRQELEKFARRLNGRGIDRIVPIGSALSFQRFWDGYDLLRELTRTVYLDSGDIL